jgi:hypothetical protein
MLASTFEEIAARRTLTALESAMVNSRTQSLAKQIFSPEPEFSWQKADGRVGNASDLLEALRSQTPLS